jgi:hypothetical protein
MAGIEADREALEHWESEGGRELAFEEESLRARSGALARSEPEQGEGSSTEQSAMTSAE